MADEPLASEAEVETAEPRGRPEVPAPAPAPARSAGGPFRVYKPGQGVHVRWGTAIGAGVIAIAGAAFVREWLRLPLQWLKLSAQRELVVRTLIPVALLALVGYLIFWLVGKKRGTVDFMIATEGEMKKVNWSSRREVLGATKVVIFTLLALGFMLAIVDLGFILVFSGIGVLRVPVWQGLLGGGGS